MEVGSRRWLGRVERVSCYVEGVLRGVFGYCVDRDEVLYR